MKEFSLYIHIPFCISKCYYCDFFSIPAKKITDEYVNSLCNEIVTRSKKYKNSLCKSIYIGGGTPSLLSPSQLEKISKFIFTCFNFTSDYEFTMELNPDDVDDLLLKSLMSAKVNRISLGLQSMSDTVLKFIHRRADKNQNLSALKLIDKKWKGKVSFDLICGLPYEEKESFLLNLQDLLSYNPDHISLYSLCVEDETLLGKMICEKSIEYDYDFTDELWILGKELLEKNGYKQYEVSNFAIEGYECKHNLAYWNHENYIGIGCGATGTEYFEDGSGCRITNNKNIEKYIAFWNDLNLVTSNSVIPQEKEFIDVETSSFEFFMMGLRKNGGIKSSDYKKYFSCPIPQDIHNLFRKWTNNDLAEIISINDDIIYKLNNKGLLFLNKFLEELLSL